MTCIICKGAGTLGSTGDKQSKICYNCDGTGHIEIRVKS